MAGGRQIVNASRLDLVPCPSCHGTTRRPVVHQSPSVVTPVQWRGKTQSCLACRTYGGKVEAWRVCPGCGNWKDSCTCTAGARNVTIVHRVVAETRADPPPPAPPASESGGVVMVAGSELDSDPADGVTPIPPARQAADPADRYVGLGEAEVSAAPASGASNQETVRSLSNSRPSKRARRIRAAGVAPICPFGLSGCKLERQGNRFWFCPRCCYAARGGG